MCVIYKLTSPSGKSYIGQSVNFESRYNKYKNNSTGSIGKYIKVETQTKNASHALVMELVYILLLESKFWEFDSPLGY